MRIQFIIFDKYAISGFTKLLINQKDYKIKFGPMSNPFSIQSQDSCLRFLREDSCQQQNQLLQNIEHLAKPSDQQEENNHLENSQISIFNKRNRNELNHKQGTSRKKIFYRDKMASLISQQDMQKCEGYNYGDYSQNVRGKSPITRQEQLKRNRQSAKNSRQRRKQYVETLEQKSNEYQKKIQDLTIRLRETELERDRLREDNKSYIKSFLASKNEGYQHLNEVLEKTGRRPCQKLSNQIQIFLSKYGAAGSERVATTDYYVKQVVQIIIGDVHKYIVDSAINDKGLFGMNGWTKFDDDICEKLRINKETRVKLSKNYRFEMMRQFDIFKAIIQKFYDAYRAVQNQAKIIQKIFQKILLEFNDAYLAELLIWVQQNKFSREMKKIRSDWARSVEEPQEQTGHSRKISACEKRFLEQKQ